MSETLLRQWSILRSLPVYPCKCTARQIEDRLEGHGFVVSKRTIERDLEKLSGLWPISADQSSRPYGWYWMEDAGVFAEARMTVARARRPRGFDLDEYIQQGAFGYPESDSRIRLKALFDATTAHHLYETPISSDQSLVPQQDGRVELTATVLDTEDLRWWLLGFGAGVEVMGPARLRKRMSRTVQAMEALYGK